MVYIMSKYKYLIAILLAVFSNVAMAEWTLIEENEKFKLYVDKKTKRIGNKVTMWVFMDLKFTDYADGVSYKGAVTKNEFDCVNETKLTKYITIYKSKNQKDAISSSELNDMMLITPNTSASTLLNVACKK